MSRKHEQHKAPKRREESSRDDMVCPAHASTSASHRQRALTIAAIREPSGTRLDGAPGSTLHCYSDETALMMTSPQASPAQTDNRMTPVAAHVTTARRRAKPRMSTTTDTSATHNATTSRQS